MNESVDLSCPAKHSQCCLEKVCSVKMLLLLLMLLPLSPLPLLLPPLLLTTTTAGGGTAKLFATR